MRRKIYSKIRNYYIIISVILFILLFSNVFISFNIVSAQEKQLFIDTTDKIYENEDFLISAYTLDENGTPTFQIDVEIEFDGEAYQIIDDSAVASIKAPQVSEDTPYTIKASKTGYASAENTITILNKLDLELTLDKHTVEENERFCVTVKDEKETPVENAKVWIQSVVGEDTTDSQGHAWLAAPEGRSKITIRAQKDGYVDGTTTVAVNIGPSWWESLQKNPYVPIFVAVILLILVIIFVNLRQKKLIDTRAREISKEQSLKRYSSHGAIVSSQPDVKIENQPVNRHGPTENIDTNLKRGPKIEEIRISRPRKEKEIVPVKTEEEEVKESIPQKIKRKYDYDWFEGTDNIRYEIDKITGKIDEDGADKWFEGIDDIRAKIDEKVKKKDKKKDK